MKNKKTISIIAIIVYVIVLLFVGKEFVERAVVKYAADAALEKIRQGPDNQTMNELVDSLISELLGDGIVGSFLQDGIGGDDVNDVYHVFIDNMQHEVVAVEKIDSGYYRIGMRITNYNNAMIGQTALELFKERYDGNILSKVKQGLNDLTSDWSQLFVALFREAEQIMVEQMGSDLIISQYYVVDYYRDDLQFENQNGEISFISVCAGFPIKAGAPQKITDEFKIYALLMVCLLAVPVGVIVYRRRKISGTCVNDQVYIGKTEAASAVPESPAVKISGTPILYARTSQHNNIPFAVHDTPIFIGRDPASCKVLFKDGSIGVSGRHCSVSFDSACGDFLLTDLRSTYGTYLSNGEKLIANTPYHLKPGDSFYTGDKSNIFSVELH